MATLVRRPTILSIAFIAIAIAIPLSAARVSGYQYQVTDYLGENFVNVAIIPTVILWSIPFLLAITVRSQIWMTLVSIYAFLHFLTLLESLGIFHGLLAWQIRGALWTIPECISQLVGAPYKVTFVLGYLLYAILGPAFAFTCVAVQRDLRGQA